MRLIDSAAGRRGGVALGCAATVRTQSCAPTRIREELGDRPAQRRHVAGLDQHGACTEVGQPADAGRDDRPRVRECLPRGKPVTVASRRDAHDRGAAVERTDLGRRDEAQRLRDPGSQRPVADDHPAQPVRRLDELEDAFLLAEAPCEEHVRGLIRRADLERQLERRRHDSHVARTQRARFACEEARRCEDEARPANERADDRRNPPRERNVRPPHLQDVGSPRRPGGDRRRDPVRVHEVRIARSRARSPCKCREECWHESRLPRRGAEVLDHSSSVGDPEVRERRGRHDLDVDPRRPCHAHRRGDEVAGHVGFVPRVRRRQDDDLHRSCEKTTGIERASAMNA